MLKAKILRATRPYKGSTCGLITFEVELSLYLWVELLTHRRFARNASSARAMSTDRYTGMGYYTPDTFYQSGKGMQSSNEPIKHQWLASQIWHGSTWLSMQAAKLLERLGVAKEQRNRLIPPNKIIRGLVTGTEDAWNAFLVLRNHPTADKAMQEFAWLVASEISSVNQTHAYNTSWIYAEAHNPFHEWDIVSSVATIARVSYNRDSGKNDQKLYDQLLADKHLSPFEHIAYWVEHPYANCYITKNEGEFNYGWESYRSRLENIGL